MPSAWVSLSTHVTASSRSLGSLDRGTNAVCQNATVLLGLSIAGQLGGGSSARTGRSRAAAKTSVAVALT